MECDRRKDKTTKMNFNNYTIKSQEALQKATEIATGNGQQVIETGHLMQAILQSDENLISFLLKKLGTTKAVLSAKLDELIASLPKGFWRSALSVKSSSSGFAKSREISQGFW